MADWDPFAVDDDSAPAAAASGGAGFKLEDTMELEGVKPRVLKRDFEKCMEVTWGKLMKEEPWQEMPDPNPDLSWHEPTCSLEDWKHTAIKCKLGVGCVYITLAKPATGNRLDADIAAALVDALFLLHTRKDLRVVVFTAEGKLFCGGGDPKGEADGGLTRGKAPSKVLESRELLGQRALKAGAFPDGQVNMARLLQTRLWHVFATLPQFTICLCNGSALGDGLGIVTCCDYAVGVKGAFFSLSDVKLGVVPAGIAPYIVAKTGTGVAKRIFCTSENLTAERAVDIGILDDAVESMDEAMQIAARLCTQLTECGPRSVQLAKELVLGVAGQQIIEPLMFYTSAMLSRAQNGEEAKQATNASWNSKPKPWEEQPIQPPK